jgi:hypothetical protein
MKIIIFEKQFKSIVKKMSNNRVVCEECGWSWDLSDGGDDPYTCHKCFHTNEEN